MSFGTRTLRIASGFAALASLAFGATQAMAKPGPVKDTRIICPFAQQACVCNGYSYCTFTNPCVCG